MRQAGLLGGEELVGEVLGLIHADPRTGFGVVELEPDDGGPGERCSGPLADLVEGQRVRLVGRRAVHPRHGPTFEAVLYEQVAPTTVAGVTAFLTSERFAHVPAAAIERLVLTFGAATAAAVESGPERLVAEARLAPDEAESVHAAWMAGQALARLVRLVDGAGWPMDAARSAHARFGADVVAVARADPYALLIADRVRFAHADALAARLGVPPDDPRRLAAGVAAVVAAAARDGHQCLPRGEAVTAAVRLLGADALIVSEGVERACAAGLLIEEAGSLWLRPHHEDEVALADGLGRLVAASPLPVGPAVGRADPGADAAAAVGPELTADQAAAVGTCLEAGVSVLTGGPGTGKSTTLRVLVARLEAAGLEVALCAPTGRAARRLEELTGRAAGTVHRLLEARPDEAGGFRFRFSAGERLPYDAIVVDEASMLDTWLAARLVEAVPDRARLVLVGDSDQLPSVGPGDVLRDVIRSGVVPVATLREVHRQAAGSRIVALARAIHAGAVPALPVVDGEVYVAEEPDRRRIAARVVRTVAERAPTHFGVPVDDVQVLAPVYRGPAGVDVLNAALKEALNPGAGRPSVGGFHVGDRVMQTRNDPELDVANGDVGTVVDLDVRAGSLRVRWGRGEVVHPRDRLRDLVPAWAVTVHKAQGGEWPVVVLVLDPSHGGMLWRALAYTAVTRATHGLILIGRGEALRVAATTIGPGGRRTGLVARLGRVC